MKDLSISARLAMQDQKSDAPEIIRISKVRRRLFDDGENPGNSDNAVNFVIEENKKDLEKAKKKWNFDFVEEKPLAIKNEIFQAKERWNFDFVEEKPLPGRYEWEKINKDEKEVEEQETKCENQKEEPKAEKSEDQ